MLPREVSYNSLKRKKSCDVFCQDFPDLVCLCVCAGQAAKEVKVKVKAPVLKVVAMLIHHFTTTQWIGEIVGAAYASSKAFL